MAVPLHFPDNMDEYETIILVKPEVFVYKIPPRTTNRGYRAADWKLDTPDWTGRMRVVSKGKECVIKLEDKNSGELFSKSPIDKYPGLAVESVMDSSRYFVLRIEDDNGRAAFIGIGFADRGDSFDLNVALQEHFKWLQKSEEIEHETEDADSKPQLDLSFKEGQTIKINMNIGNKSGNAKPRPKAASTGGLPGLLPPPPGCTKFPSPSASKAPKEMVTVPTKTSNSSAQGHGINDLLLDLDSPTANLSSVSEPSAAVPAPDPDPAPKAASTDFWGDFAKAPANPPPTQASSGAGSTGNWIDF